MGRDSRIFTPEAAQELVSSLDATFDRIAELLTQLTETAVEMAGHGSSAAQRMAVAVALTNAGVMEQDTLTRLQARVEELTTMQAHGTRAILEAGDLADTGTKH